MPTIVGVAYHAPPRFSGTGTRGLVWARVQLACHYSALLLIVLGLGLGWPWVFAIGAALMALALALFAWRSGRHCASSWHFRVRYTKATDTMSRLSLRCIKAALVALTCGIGLGAWFALDRSAGAWLRPLHAELNLWGWATLLIDGMGYHMLPRFLGRPLVRTRPAALQSWLAIPWAWRWHRSAGRACCLAGHPPKRSWNRRRRNPGCRRTAVRAANR